MRVWQVIAIVTAIWLFTKPKWRTAILGFLIFLVAVGLAPP